MRLHPAGRPVVTRFLAIGILLLLVPALMDSLLWLRPLGGVSLAGGLFLCWFYRDPERAFSGGDQAIVAGADGKVIQVIQREHIPELGGPGTQVSIFMSPLNVHVNRAAMAGRVAQVVYRPGEYLMAFHEKSSELNEANLLVLPNIDAANIAYNLLKTAAGGGIAVGPVLLGAAKPVHILTATATVRRLVNMTALAVVDANHLREKAGI